MPVIGNSFANPAEFLKAANSARLQNPNSWHIFRGKVGQSEVELKFFGTWNQVFRVNGQSKTDGTMEKKVSAWKNEILAGF